METTAGGAAVCDDPDRAAELIAAGQDVVLIVSPDGGAGTPPFPTLAAGRGRLALLVGRLGDPRVRQAARAMADELFGPRAGPGGAT